MGLPKARGSLGEMVFEALRRLPDRWPDAAMAGVEPESDEDAAVVLWALYELSYRGFVDVDDQAEWEPGVLAVRRSLEQAFEDRLRARFPGVPAQVRDQPVGDAIFAYVAGHDGPSVARFVQTRADREQVIDLLRMRSVYHLKETDPVSWALPRLPVRTQAALMELMFDEYGGGDPNRHHAHLFALGLEAVGLRPEYGAYLDEAPPEALDLNNAMSLFGLHRRLRGAALGHLAAFETTSSMPSRRMAAGLERVGLGGAMADYYREHVEADAVHEQLAVRTVIEPLVAEEPEITAEVWFGVFSCLDLEDRFARAVLARWEVTR